MARGEGEPPASFPPRKVELWRHILATGCAGTSLLHAYLSFVQESQSGADLSIADLDRAADFIASERTVESLYFGFPGVAWVTAHLAARLFEDDPEDGVDLDATLIGSASSFTGPDREYDLINGWVGLGVLALERLPRPSARQLLETVVERLDGRALREEDGAAFFTPPDRMLDFYLPIYPSGAYNLGLAHGIAGVIAMLGAACHAGVAVERARPLLDACVAWLLAHEQPDGAPFRFAPFFDPAYTAGRSRLAWCYGDLGIAAALLVAAQGTGEAGWRQEAIRIARAATGRDPEQTGIEDAALCHGTAGAGHLFNRIYQETGDPDCAEAARFWLRRTLSLRRPGRGIAGFTKRDRDEEGRAIERAEPGLLGGAAGIGLALLAAASSVEPEWDRAFLLTPPPD